MSASALLLAPEARPQPDAEDYARRLAESEAKLRDLAEQRTRASLSVADGLPGAVAQLARIKRAIVVETETFEDLTDALHALRRRQEAEAEQRALAEFKRRERAVKNTADRFAANANALTASFERWCADLASFEAELGAFFVTVPEIEGRPLLDALRLRMLAAMATALPRAWRIPLHPQNPPQERPGYRFRLDVEAELEKAGVIRAQDWPSVAAGGGTTRAKSDEPEEQETV